MNPPIRYSDDVETVSPDEAEVIGELNDTFDLILKRTSADYGHAVRAVHAKSHGVLAATLTVLPDLPAELAQGMFATPGEHRAWMRFSTNAGDILPDTIGLPRGLALKVLDVAGERLPGAEGTTQDFVMVDAPAFRARTAKDFLSSLKLLAKTTDRIEGTKVAVAKVLRGADAVLSKVGIESGFVRGLGGMPNVDPLGETYWSETPFRYGDHIAKFAVVPVSPQLTQRTGEAIEITGPDSVRETVRAEMAGTEAAWELRVQLCRDLARQPVEDPTVPWDEADTPFQAVARIVAPPQDSWDAALVREVDEGMRFSVWTGLAAHRPLGNINRARRDAYDHSARFRGEFNRCPLHEPG